MYRCLLCNRLLRRCYSCAVIRASLRSDSSRYRYARFVDLEKGLVRRAIFVDDRIFQRELRQIFGRCWLYLAHESEIPARGDFVTVKMGLEPVIVCRASDHKIRAFLNTCRHRGNLVCRVDCGNTNTFICAYHGWSYDLHGRLAGVPGARTLYDGDLDQSQLGLVAVAQVSSYKGLIFGTFDPEAPSLDSYLGDMRWGLDLLLDQGDLVAVPGRMRWFTDCNWKLPADNAAGDVYHFLWTHRSAVLAGHSDGNGATRSGVESLTPSKDDGFTMLAAYGHGFNADWIDASVDWTSPLTAWRRDVAVQQRLGPLRLRVHRANQNIFPNLFVNTGSRDLMIRNPVSATRTETWKTVLVDRNAAPAVQRMQVRASNRHFGPAGMFEQDDGENWSQCTATSRGELARRLDFHYGMGLGHNGIVADGGSPSRIDSLMNENAQRWMYRAWVEFMDAPT